MQALHTRKYSQLQQLGIHNKYLMAKVVCCGQCHLSCHMGTIVYSPLQLGYWAVILPSSGAVLLDQKHSLLRRTCLSTDLHCRTNLKEYFRESVNFPTPRILQSCENPLFVRSSFVKMQWGATNSLMSCKAHKLLHCVAMPAQASEQKAQCIPHIGPVRDSHCTSAMWAPAPSGRFSPNTSGWHSWPDHVSCSDTSWICWTS